MVEQSLPKQDANIGYQPDALLVAGEEGSPVQIPASPHFIDERRVKAEELFKKLK